MADRFYEKGKPIRWRADFFGSPGTEQPFYQPIAALALLEDYLSGKLCADTVSIGLQLTPDYSHGASELTEYEKGFRERLRKIHQERQEYVQRLVAERQ